MSVGEFSSSICFRVTFFFRFFTLFGFSVFSFSLLSVSRKELECGEEKTCPFKGAASRVGGERSVGVVPLEEDDDVNEMELV